jgi:MoaD family protein
MAITVNIPTILRPLTDNQRRVELSGATVQDIIENLNQQHVGIKEKLLADGQLHKFINIYVNDDDIRFTEGLATTVKEGDSVTILPSVAGG